MKLSINSGARRAIQTDLLSACERFNREVASNDGGIDARVRIDMARNAIASAACLVISHATRGKLYPLMTEKTYKGGAA